MSLALTIFVRGFTSGECAQLRQVDRSAIGVNLRTLLSRCAVRVTRSPFQIYRQNYLAEASTSLRVKQNQVQRFEHWVAKRSCRLMETFNFKLLLARRAT